jgi:hypothetical protein
VIYKKFSRMPGQVVYQNEGASASVEDYESFHQSITLLSNAYERKWTWLLEQEPTIRLKIMLIRCMERMIDSNVVTVVPEGLLKDELDMLDAVSGFHPQLQLVAHELFCIRERQLFVDSFRQIFNAHKCKGES